jgi:hypothetical protein
MLAGLKKANAGISADKQDNIVLQFNVGEQSQYLPLFYQIQAAESKTVQLQSQINFNTANYRYYENLSGLSARIIAELNDKLSSGQNYTIELFRSFLADLIDEIEKQELKDYLASYIKKIDNRISISHPVSEKPKMYSIAKGTVRKSAIVFAVSLIILVFTSFLLEGLKQNKMKKDKLEKK